MAWFFIGLVSLVAGLAVAELLVRLSPKRLLRYLRWIGIFIIVVTAILFLFVGLRSLLLGAMLALALSLLSRVGQTRSPFSGQPRPDPSAHKSSNIETRYLRMTLDHETGDIDGEVRDGAKAGRVLSSLRLLELLDLLAELYQNDEESVPVLEAYLDRVFGASWRTQKEAPDGATDGSGMTVDKALNILGLKPGATESEIREAHRQLMMKVHPDKGGSDFLASQINAAKDFLLGTG